MPINLSPEFGFDMWFDQCYTVGSTAYYPQGLDVRKTDGALDHFVSSLSQKHPLKSIGNGVVSASIKISDLLPIRSAFDNGAKSIKSLSQNLIDSSDEPFFLFTNFMEAHHPHRLTRGYEKGTEVPKRWSSDEIDLMAFNDGIRSVKHNKEYVENFRSLYQASVDYLDRILASYVQDIQERTDNEVTFIITADHGENLGYESDNHLFGHTGSLSEGLLHVPFDIINPPKEAEINENGTFSQTSLPNIVNQLVREEQITLQKSRYVSAEVVNGGLLESPDNYWDRMIRCVYDTEVQKKITWDTTGD
ncbi:MAG: sulfatase-like hydrolase/transferase, partial [Halobacteriaceae archaeon]